MNSRRRNKRSCTWNIGLILGHCGPYAVVLAICFLYCKINSIGNIVYESSSKNSESQASIMRVVGEIQAAVESLGTSHKQNKFVIDLFSSTATTKDSLHFLLTGGSLMNLQTIESITEQRKDSIA